MNLEEKFPDSDFESFREWIYDNIDPSQYDSLSEFLADIRDQFTGTIEDIAVELAKEIWERETVLEITKDETEITRITPEEAKEAKPLEVSRGVIYRVQETASYAVKAVKKFIRFVRFW